VIKISCVKKKQQKKNKGIFLMRIGKKAFLNMKLNSNIMMKNTDMFNEVKNKNVCKIKDI
jgi:hypothetical protein